jgi:enoyl-CoA hydratase/carnithine racemase
VWIDAFQTSNRVAEDPHESALSLAKEIVARSPDCVAATKQLYQKTWYSSEEEGLALETKLQKQLLLSLNQVIWVTAMNNWMLRH